MTHRTLAAVGPVVLVLGTAALALRAVSPVAPVVTILVGAAALYVPIASVDGSRSLYTKALVLGLGVATFAIAAMVVPWAAGPAAAGSWAPRTGTALVASIGAAVAEEALFRRVAYTLIRPLGALPAVVAGAIVFALIHVPLYGWGGVPIDVGAGLFLGWQRWASGVWAVPAATHAMANAFAFI